VSVEAADISVPAYVSSPIIFEHDYHNCEWR